MDSIHSDTFLERILPLLSALDGVELRLSNQGVPGTVLFDGRKIPLVVTPSFFRKFSCPTTCNVCCQSLPQLTLDWLPQEEEYLELYPTMKNDFVEREVLVFLGGKGVSIPVRSLFKGSKETRRCSYLGKVEGREGLGCTLWPNAPVECLSAYSMMFGIREDRVLLSSRGVGRSWAYNPRPECGFTPELDFKDFSRKLELIGRYSEMAEELNLKEARRKLEFCRIRTEQEFRSCSSSKLFPSNNLVIT